jgi:arginase
MNVHVLAVPYDSGHRKVRLGRGPGHLLRSGLAEELRARGQKVEVEWIEAEAPFPAEIATTFELARRLSGRVSAACSGGSFPLVLAGNCSASLGALGGLGGEAGVLWLDAHGDLNTPETTRSGFLDGMALAVATGRCWAGMAGTVPGFRPVPEERVVLLGARDLDPQEEALLARSRMARVRPGEGAAAALDALAGRVRRIYLHLDLDVLDPSVGRVNGYAAPGGLTVEEVEEVIRGAGARFEIVAATLSAYDPDADPEGRIPPAAARLAAAIAEEAA